MFASMIQLLSVHTFVLSNHEVVWNWEWSLFGLLEQKC